MPIEHHAGGGTTLTGDSISYFRLCAMRGAVELETKGIKVRRGPVVWKQAQREFNIKGNRAAVLAWLNAKVAELQAQQEHIVEEGGRKVRTVAGVEIS